MKLLIFWICLRLFLDFSNALSNHCNVAWVTRPERTKGVKDEVKQVPSRPEVRPWRGPQNSNTYIVRFPDSQVPRLTWVGEPDSNTYSYSYRYIPCHERIVKIVGKDVVSFTNLSSQSDNLTDKDVGKKSDSDSWFLFFAKIFQRPMLFWAGFPYCRDHISTCRLFNIGNSATQHNQVAQWPEYTREKIFTQRNPSWQGLVFKT